MLFRTLTSLLVTGLLTTVSWAAPADSLGLAQSTKGFKINRDASVVDGRADALTKVMSGDQIEASDKPVRVQTTTGGTVLVQGRGAAKFVSSDSLDVLSGDVYVAVPTKSKMSVLVADLMIQPLDPNPARAGQHLIQVSRVNEGRVRITGYNHALSVAPKTGGDALAVIGDKDTVELAKTDKGWVVVQADEPADEDKPADDESGEESEDEEERRGAFWWWWPVGIGALAGGAILIGEALDGDDDDDDDDRGPTSRITSGPSESESEDEESAFTFSFF